MWKQSQFKPGLGGRRMVAAMKMIRVCRQNFLSTTVAGERSVCFSLMNDLEIERLDFTSQDIKVSEYFVGLKLPGSRELPLCLC